MTGPDTLGNENSVFENEPCGRCGGSGRYSFNLMHGDRCYGCGGRGYRFTKRGAAAQRMYADSLTAPVETLQAGQKVRFPGTPGVSAGGWSTIETITKRDQPSLINGEPVDAYDLSFIVTTPNGLGGYHGMTAGTPVRIAHDAEAKQANLAAAVAYQATLTKQGKPRKGSQVAS